MKVTFTESAENQFRDIQASFREINRSLATRFAEEVRSAVQRLETFPRSGYMVGKARRVILRRSRYLMLYQITETQIYVTKLVHQKKRPE